MRCILLIILVFCEAKFSTSVANNVHTFDGGGNAEFIGSEVFFEILEPAEISYTFKIRPAKDFGAPFNQSFRVSGAKLVPVDPPCGCGWSRNADELEGTIALIERGECSFLSKVLRAEEAGAMAAIICDNHATNDAYFIEMIDDRTGRDSNIPAGFLLGKNGFMIREKLAKLKLKYAIINLPVNLTNVAPHKMKQPPWVNW